MSYRRKAMEIIRTIYQCNKIRIYCWGIIFRWTYTLFHAIVAIHHNLYTFKNLHAILSFMNILNTRDVRIFHPPPFFMSLHCIFLRGIIIITHCIEISIDEKWLLRNRRCFRRYGEFLCRKIERVIFRSNFLDFSNRDQSNQTANKTLFPWT